MTLRGRSPRAVSPAAFIRRGRVVAVAAVVLAGLAAAPGEAAAPKPTVLRARSSASVDVTFTRAVSIDPEAVRVSGGRNYAGYYLHPLNGSLHNGTGALFLHGYRLPAVPHVQWLPMPLGLGDFGESYPRTIPAGRYRLYVLADAPVEVRVPIGGYTARTIQATRPIRAAYAGKDVTKDVLPASLAGVATPGAVSASLPITVVSDTNVSLTTLQVLSHGSYYTRHYTQPSSCIGQPGVVDADNTSCRMEPDDGWGSAFHRGQYSFDTSPLRNGVLEDETNHVYYPGRLTAGKKTAHFTVGPMTHVIDRVFVAAFSFGL